MKRGFQTIAYGPDIPPGKMKEIVRELKGEGFVGIEIAQRWNRLGVRDLDELQDIIEEGALKLIGLAGGKPEDRIGFCNTSSRRPEYVYIENLEPWMLPAAAHVETKLALHPHAFITRRTKVLVREAADGTRQRVLAPHSWRTSLEHHPELQFLPDTAHLWIMGEDPADAILAYQERIPAVHLKDWSLVGGRSSLRYARGFRDLGKGDLGDKSLNGQSCLEEVLQLLKALDYQGWVIAEIDAPERHPTESIKLANAWLTEHGVP